MPCYSFVQPNGFRLSGERRRAERVHCSRGLGDRCFLATLHTNENANQRANPNSNVLQCSSDRHPDGTPIAIHIPMLVARSFTCAIGRLTVCGSAAKRSRASSLPPITMFQDVMRKHVAPRDEWDKNNNHQDGFDVFCRRCIDLVGRP